MKLARIVAAASMGCAAVSTSAAELVGGALRAHTEDRARWGTPALVVKPEYPRAALESRQKGIVEVEGMFDGTGKLSQVVYRPVSPAAEVFVPALQKVVPHWVFYVPVGSDCLPTPQKVTTQVEFAADGAEPRIFISYSKPQAGPRPESAEPLRPVHRRATQYPRSLRDAKLEARVYARLEIAPTRDVSRVTAVAYPTPGAPKTVEIEFEEEARRGLMGWRYPPAPQGSRGNRAVCQTVLFQVTD